jgi:hypothetical protein
MIDTREFGLEEGINEIIAVTVNPDGRANAAPIGIHKQGEHHRVHLYQNRTRENITRTKHFTANITHDPLLFVVSALSAPPQSEYAVLQHSGQTHYVLRNAEAWILFRVQREKDGVCCLQPLEGKAFPQMPRAVNRGCHAVIEATVHATRYVLFHSEQQLGRIRYYSDIVSRCGSPREMQAMKMLYELCGISED